jgi:hypothetical protein
MAGMNSLVYWLYAIRHCAKLTVLSDNLLVLISFALQLGLGSRRIQVPYFSSVFNLSLFLS